MGSNTCFEGLLEEKYWIKHYNSSHKILLVGEGDFSFSLCLSKAFVSVTKKLVAASKVFIPSNSSNMVATSLDSQGFVFSNYNNGMSNLMTLRSEGCQVIHEVDATSMAKHYLLHDRKFDRIVFNFPHADYIPGDSRENQLRRHRNLVRMFFANAVQMLERHGEVHVTHKTNGFHGEWNLPELASESRLRLIEEVEFKLQDYPGYSNKYGFKGDESFNCYPSKTYKFAQVWF